MEYYTKITRKNQTTRVVAGSQTHAMTLRDKFMAIAEQHKLNVDIRIYQYPSDQRSAGEVRSAMRLLDLIL